MKASTRTSKLQFLEPREVSSHIVFRRNSARHSVFADALNRIAAKPGSALKIGTNLLQSVKNAAKKLGVDLVFGEDGADILVRIVILSESQRRLFLLLREPRTIDELKTKKLELSVEDELGRLSSQGLVKLDKRGNWQLTASGVERIPAVTGAAAE